MPHPPQACVTPPPSTHPLRLLFLLRGCVCRVPGRRRLHQLGQLQQRPPQTVHVDGQLQHALVADLFYGGLQS